MSGVALGGRWRSLRRPAVASGSSRLCGTVFDVGLSARPFTVPAMTNGWDPEQQGILVLPSGRLVRGRGLSKPFPDGPWPEFGLYLLGRDPGPILAGAKGAGGSNDRPSKPLDGLGPKELTSLGDEQQTSNTWERKRHRKQHVPTTNSRGSCL